MKMELWRVWQYFSVWGRLLKGPDGPSRGAVRCGVQSLHSRAGPPGSVLWWTLASSRSSTEKGPVVPWPDDIRSEETRFGPGSEPVTENRRTECTCRPAPL